MRFSVGADSMDIFVRASKTGRLSKEKWVEVDAVMKRLKASDLHVDERSGVKPAYMRSQIMRFEAWVGRKAGLVLVDYF